MSGRLLNIFHFNKIFWWLVCLLLFGNIIFFLTVRTTQKNRLSELEDRYSAGRNQLTPKTDENQTRYLKAREDIGLFKEGLPDKKDFAEVASELFAILKKHKIEVGQSIYKPESIDIKGMYKYSTSLNIKGNYPVLKAVLADIQESKTMFCVENLSISSNPDDVVEMKLKIATYFTYS